MTSEATHSLTLSPVGVLSIMLVLGKMAIGKNGHWKKWPLEEMAIGRNGHWKKWPLEEMVANSLTFLRQLNQSVHSQQ